MSSEHLAELAHDNVEDCVQFCRCVPEQHRPRFRRMLSTCLTALFTCLDGFVRMLGPLFVTLVWILIGAIVYCWYTILAPFLYYFHHGFVTMLFYVIGHWLLVNIVFHYYKVTTVKPGSPPQLESSDQRRAIQLGFRLCKKCNLVKPNRCHHCQVCKRCILNMDHHCPWINNCVGHFNHRYFFLFMAFIWVGCLYVVIASWAPFFAPIGSLESLAISPQERSRLSFTFVLTAAVLIALGFLFAWHIYLISTGQTTIEFYSNLTAKSEAKERKERFVNYYDFGWQKNWALFLGLNETRSFWRHILLPSSHLPIGDGLTWRTNYSATTNV